MSGRRALPVALALAALACAAGAASGERAGDAAEPRDADLVVTLDGTLTEVERPFATLRTDGERVYTVHLGPTWFWEREGYAVRPGDRVEITGRLSVEGDVAHLFPHTMVRDGETYTLSGSRGIPRWSRGPGEGPQRGGATGDGRRGCGHGCGEGHHHHRCGGCCGSRGAS